MSSLFSTAFVTRLMKDSLTDVMQQSYIRTARSKGISEFRVIFRHGLRNAILPVITYMGPMLASMLTGSFVVERVFGIPGIGYLFTTSVLNRDYTLIMGITIFFSVLLSFFSLLVDVIYMLVDPTIRLEGK
ncbi:MAG: ABC transporter permease [Eubacteriales bacterium]